MNLPPLLKSAAREVILRLRPLPPHPYPEQFGAQMDLAPFEGRPRVYLIASTPRCGSHFLGHALTESGAFGVPLEYLNRSNLCHWQARFRTANEARIMARLIRLRTSPSGWFGLKAHWGQFGQQRQGPMLAALGSIERAIWIYRRDLLAQAVSFVIADQTGQWISGAARQGTPVYDGAAIAAAARHIRFGNQRWAGFFAENFGSPMWEVVYEDLLANPAGELAQVAAFLDSGADTLPAPSERTRKQGNGLNDDWAARFRAEAGEADRWILDPPPWTGTGAGAAT